MAPPWKDQDLALKIWPLLALDPALLVEMVEKPKGLRGMKDECSRVQKDKGS